MSWYDEVRQFTRRGRYDDGYGGGYEPHTAAFAGPGLFSPGLLGGAGYVNWRERPTGFDPPEGRGRYGYDYGYRRRSRYADDLRFRRSAPHRGRGGRPARPYDRGWRAW